jgi:uncharacterized lipoprotein YmbA
MTRILIIAALLVLAGCSSFKLGTMLYVPHGESASLTVGASASAPQ